MTIALLVNGPTTVGQRKRLAFYIGLNIEHFSFGEGLGIRQQTLVFNLMSEITRGETTGFGSVFGEF